MGEVGWGVGEAGAAKRRWLGRPFHWRKDTKSGQLSYAALADTAGLGRYVGVGELGVVGDQLPHRAHWGRWGRGGKRLHD